MPDIQVDIGPLGAVLPKGGNHVRHQIIPRQSGRHDEGFVTQRKEHLPAVRMIVHVPQQHLVPRRGGTFQLRLLRVGRLARQIPVIDRFVLAVKNIAAPFAAEGALDPAAFIPGSLVNRTPGLDGPLNAVDFNGVRVFYQAAIACKAILGRPDQRHLMPDFNGISNFPKTGRLKLPSFAVSVVSRFSDLQHRFWRIAAPFWRWRRCDGGVCAGAFRYQFCVAAQAVSGAFGLDNDGVTQQPFQ